MKRSCLLTFRRGALCAALLVTGAFAAPVLADDPFLILQDARLELVRLAQPDQLSQSVSFSIDECTFLRFDVVSDSGSLTATLTGPAGQSITPATVESLGGFYAQFEVEESEGPSILLSTRPGFHYQYLLPTLGPGTYTVTVSAPGDLDEEAAVLIELLTDSPFVAAAFSPTPLVLRGGQAVVTAAAYESGAPVTGATVTAQVVAPDGSVAPLTLADNGLDADEAVGDGLYNALFTAAQSGSYTIVVTINAETSGGTPVQRSASFGIEAIEGGATLSGSFADRGVDLNGNGLFDQIAFDAGVEVTVPGEYGLAALLRTSDGDEVLGVGQAVLVAGPQTLTAVFSAADLIATGDNGPWTIVTIELVWLSPDGALTVDALVEQTYATAAYLQSQLERPPIYLTGDSSDAPVDLDLDEDFDLLTVAVGIVVRTAGTYSYTVALFDECGGQIEFLTGSQFFPGGLTPATLNLSFDGRMIGQAGIGGQFRIKDLALYGPGGTLVQVEVAATESYDVTRFDGYTPARDCNNNGIPDSCEILAGAGDCNGDGILDECEPDCNGNGIPDSCDLLTGASTDCNGNGIPDECDLASYTSADCDGNGVPDECESLSTPDVVSSVPAVLGYQSIHTTGTPLNLSDDGVATITMPFTTSYFPNPTVRVSNNGGIGFGGSSSLDYINGRIPNTFAFGGAQALFPFWDDIDSDTGNVYWQVLGAAPNRTLVVEWYNRPHYPGDLILDGDEVAFQVQVFETPAGRSIAQFLYFDTTFLNPSWDDGASASIGYQDSGLSGFEYSFNQPGAVTAGTVLTVRAPQAKTICRLGDVNCDGAVNFNDISAFVVALTGETGYLTQFPGCQYNLADTDESGAVDFDDIGPFIELLIAG